MAIEVTEDYRSLLVAVKHRIRAAQYEALKAVNRELMALYWNIGELIVTRQESAGWGKSVVEQLAQDLQVEFHGMAGFSARNIWNMRNFYVTYRTKEKLQPMVAEIGWTHNLVILESKDRTIVEYALRQSNRAIALCNLSNCVVFAVGVTGTVACSRAGG